MKTSHPGKPVRGFTLLEILVVITVVATLVAAAVGVFTTVRGKARTVEDLSRFRRLGQAISGWADENHGRFPRSSHSATGYRQLGWEREILPHLGLPDSSRATLETARPEFFGFTPGQPGQRRPALNVYFELDPGIDDYDGAPARWPGPGHLPNPAHTVLLVQTLEPYDHIMAHYFGAAKVEMPARSDNRDGVVLWADWRATQEPPDALYDPSNNRDHFHPEKAGYSSR